MMRRHRGEGGVWRAIGRQLREPRGRAGRVLGWLLVLLNEAPSRRAIAALQLVAGEAVLELGFGPGRSVAAMAAGRQGAIVTGLDHSTDMLRMARRRNRRAIAGRRVTLVSGRFNALPWGDASFDKILLLNVLYFFDLPGRDAAEMFRVLKPGGRIVAYVTERQTMRRWPFSGPDTHRTFDAGELAALLRGGGPPHAMVSVERLALPLGITGLLAVADR